MGKTDARKACVQDIPGVPSVDTFGRATFCDCIDRRCVCRVYCDGVYDCAAYPLACTYPGLSSICALIEASTEKARVNYIWVCRINGHAGNASCDQSYVLAGPTERLVR